LTFLIEIYGLLLTVPALSNAGLPNVLEHFCDEKHRATLFPSGSIGRISILGSLFLIIGGGIRIAAYRVMGRLYTWEVSIKAGHKLASTGPYAWVRHPGYTGSALAKIGFILHLSAPRSVLNECIMQRYPMLVRFIFWSNTLAALSTVPCLWKRAAEEDLLMYKEFDTDWKKWAEAVPYRFIPYVF